MITWVWASPWRSHILRLWGASEGLTEARRLSNAEFIPAASGLSASNTSSPSNAAAAAAGRMNRHADTPAARMATSSLRRLRVTNVPSTPNRKTNGSSCRITDGDFSTVRATSVRKPTSAFPPSVRDRSTKSISRTTAPSRAAADPTPTRVWAKMYSSIRVTRTFMRGRPPTA